MHLHADMTHLIISYTVATNSQLPPRSGAPSLMLEIPDAMCSCPWQKCRGKGTLAKRLMNVGQEGLGHGKMHFFLMHSEELAVEMVVKLWKKWIWELRISIWFILGYSRLHSRSFSLHVCCLGLYELVCIDPVDSWLCFIVGWSHLSLLIFWNGLYYLVGGSEHFLFLQKYWEINHDPNWLSHIFQKV